MRRAIDHGRSEVYAAERQAFLGTDLEELRPFDDLKQLFEQVTAAEWWTVPAVKLRRSRSDALTSVARFRAGDVPSISLARDQMTTATLIHELAHVLAGLRAGHGPYFRRAHVDLVNCYVGVREGGWLKESYEGFGLSMGSRSWPNPPQRGGPIAL
jgi:hypothetical protein